MTTGALRYAGRRAPQIGDRTLGLVAVLAAVPVGAALAFALYQYPPSLPLAIAGGIGLVAVLALALARVHVAVALGFALLGVVLVDPAPSDGVFCVVMLVTLLSGRVQLRAVPRPIVGLLAAWAALNVMSSVEVTDVTRALTFFSISLYLVLLALWLPSYVVSEDRSRLILRAYLFAAVASALVGVLAVLGLIPGAALLTEDDRARALFRDPNVFGPFLIPAALIVAEEMVRPRLLRARMPVKALVLAVLLLGVLFSYSRGAWLNAALAFGVMGVVLVLRGGTRQAGRLLAIAVGVVAVLGVVIALTGSWDFLVERARPQGYDTARFGGQRAALGPAQEYPLGAGPGQFESIAGISAHSTYARSLGEQGFPGLVVLVALLGATLVIAVGNVARGRDTQGIGAAALLAAWCGLLANSAFVDTLHWRHLWVVAALIWAGAIRSRAGPRRL